MGPSRQWQARLAGEIQRLREVLTTITGLAHDNMPRAKQEAIEALKIDPDDKGRL